MYGGRPGYGGKLPYAGMGERSQALYNLSGVGRNGMGPYLGSIIGEDDAESERWHGTYLGDFFDDVAGISGKISAVASKVSDVVTGKASVTTVPTGYSSFSFPVGGGQYSQTVPLWVLGAGAGVLLLLAMRPRRSR